MPAAKRRPAAKAASRSGSKSETALARAPSRPAPEPAVATVPSLPPPLDKTQRALLAEALRRAEETRNVVEDALLDFGRWLLVQVFHDDARAALDDKRSNPVWRVLLERAGGPTLRLDKRFLYVSLAIAAHDKRIQDDAWRLLEPGRKELLLPLHDEAAMREGAQHVVRMKLSQRATRAYVRGRLAAKGAPATVRVTASGFRAQVLKFRGRVGAPGYQEKLERTLRGMPNKERAAMQKELEAMRAWATGLIGVIRQG